MKTEIKPRKQKKELFKHINEHLKDKPIKREAFCGSIITHIDPIAHQKKMRNEWK